MENINRNKLLRLLGRHARIALDSSVFIYVFEEHPTFGSVCKKIFNKVSDRKLDVVTSVITVSEVLVQPIKQKKKEIVFLYEQAFAVMEGLQVIDVDIDIARIGAALRAKYGCTLPDAFQIAAALKGRADIFLTNDKKLRKVKDVPVVCLSDFVE